VVRKVNVLGTGISAATPQIALQAISRWIESGQRQYVCVCSVHVVMECERDPELQMMVNNAALAVPDGMPLVWLAHLAGQRYVRRVYGPDLMLAFCQLAASRGYTNYLLGSFPGRAEEVARSLTARYPGLSITGTRATLHRPLPADENEVVVQEINTIDPDVVWVGMGTGFQERWMAENRASLNARVLISVGAAFDIHSNRVRQAPAWMQRAGLEWSFRLAQEPRRLWRRYLVGNPLFVLKVVGQRLGLKRYPLLGEAADLLPEIGPGLRTASRSQSDLVPIKSKP
jgi:N-acetylglucosaminyldiphosphoundecaprenol N-acetyl-beta-D-mannosaminyltransferase